MSLKFFAFLLASLPLTAASVPVKPESVGLSEERLSRIHDTMQRHIDAKNISGAVTLVARKGRIAHFQTHGLMYIEANQPMAKDTIFRIFSMSKPVAGVAIMMLLEQGKVRLNDPVSKFIPEFKGMKVSVAEETSCGNAGARTGTLLHDAVVTRDHHSGSADPRFGFG